MIPRYIIFSNCQRIDEEYPVEAVNTVKAFLLSENEAFCEFCYEKRRVEVMSALNGNMPVLALAGLISQYDDDFYSFSIDFILKCNLELRQSGAATKI